MTQRKAHQFRLATILSARGGYLAVILLATIVEVVANPELSGLRSRLRFALNPPLGWASAYDALRNVLLFAGLGAIWLVTSPPTRLRVAVLRATAVGAALSGTVEVLQLFTDQRFASMADVVTNTVGGFVGALAAGVLVAAVRWQRGHRSTLGVPLFLFAIGHLGAVLSETLTPLFGSVPRPGIFGGPRTRLRAMLGEAHWHAGATSVFDFALAMPAGAFGVAALMELGMAGPRALILTSLLGAVGILAVEVSHGALGLPIEWTIVLTRSAGLVVGAIISLLVRPTVHRRQGVHRARMIALLTVLATALWCWRPLIPRESAREIVQGIANTAWLPLREWPYRASLLGVSQVVQLASLGFMAGALLAVWPLRSRGPLSYVWPAAVLAALIELGHAFIAGRIVDVTGFLLLFAGAWLGDAVVRRAGFTAYGEMLG